MYDSSVQVITGIITNRIKQCYWLYLYACGPSELSTLWSLFEDPSDCDPYFQILSHPQSSSDTWRIHRNVSYMTYASYHGQCQGNIAGLWIQKQIEAYHFVMSLMDGETSIGLGRWFNSCMMLASLTGISFLRNFTEVFSHATLLSWSISKHTIK